MKTLDIELHPQYLVDEEGRPKSVLIDYRAYQEILEVIEDLSCEDVILERLKEPDVDFPEKLEDIL